MKPEQKQTLGSMLRTLSNDMMSEASKSLSAKLSRRLTMRQCYALHCIVIGEHTCEDTRSSRTTMVRDGYLYHIDCPARTRALNGKVKKVYRLTDLGEQIYAEILAKFQPVVERINAKLEKTS
jgi:hypothetical protein